MFLLVKWDEHNSVTVLKETEEQKSKEIGDSITVFYGKEPYKGVIISRSENEAFLKTLTVSNEGEILMDQKKELSTSLLSKRKTSKSVDKKLQMLRSKNDATINSKIKDLSKNISQNPKTNDVKGESKNEQQIGAKNQPKIISEEGVSSKIKIVKPVCQEKNMDNTSKEENAAALKLKQTMRAKTNKLFEKHLLTNRDLQCNLGESKNEKQIGAKNQPKVISEEGDSSKIKIVKPVSQEIPKEKKNNKLEKLVKTGDTENRNKQIEKKNSKKTQKEQQEQHKISKENKNSELEKLIRTEEQEQQEMLKEIEKKNNKKHKKNNKNSKKC
ncbi:SUN domain-containing protein 2-like [Leptopilina heterotoma]|uniref:SUN domain-containing protein 2-like n=1 Tax=Leptopilina heterotoma TaxID=63436 RepID=UPI001CA88F11|nr:SUN domain-containing protein 2-like [Leptopilina heterotoma]